MVAFQGVVFDLDDTLYYERDYVRSGFEAVASTLAPEPLRQELFTHMWDMFCSGVRGKIFNELLQHYPGLGDIAISDLVTVYRQHSPKIDFLPEIEDLLVELKTEGVKLAVISDGPHASQHAKAKSLELNRYASAIILTDAWGRPFWKPHDRAFREIEKALAVPVNQLIYVADNPEKDFHGPNKLGWSSIRLRLPMQLRCDTDFLQEAKPTWEVRSVRKLRELLLSVKPGIDV